MIYQLLADLVVLVHFLFIVFVLLGGLLVLYRRWIIWLHLPAALWGFAIELFGWYCPLTPLENWLRALAGSGVYSGGFISHYLLPIIYPAGLTRDWQLLLSLVVVIFNLLIYLWVWQRYRKRQAPMI
ncbi:MAG: DUF2784 domain-containing protein [Gammaproteobacteria bacterium]|nr:DUF2784 domain-containing protein [Gammaproteobacteria bacterium]